MLCSFYWLDQFSEVSVFFDLVVIISFLICSSYLDAFCNAASGFRLMKLRWKLIPKILKFQLHGLVVLEVYIRKPLPRTHPFLYTLTHANFILQGRMSIRWRQLLIFSTNQQESESFVPKKEVNLKTRPVPFSY